MNQNHGAFVADIGTHFVNDIALSIHRVHVFGCSNVCFNPVCCQPFSYLVLIIVSLAPDGGRP